jgi:hypothetical protein
MHRGSALIERTILASLTIILAILTITTATPRFHRARMYAHETAAITAVKTIQTAQILYTARYGHCAGSLRELGPPAAGRPSSASSAGMISADLARGVAEGYQFSLTTMPNTCKAILHPVLW